MKTTIIAALAALVVATTAFAQKEPSVGAINMQRLLAGYNAYQSALEKYEGAISPAEEELANLQRNCRDAIRSGTGSEKR